MNFRLKYQMLKNMTDENTESRLNIIKEMEDRFSSIENGPLKLQVLAMDTYFERFQNFEKCEDSWGELDVTVEKFKKLLLSSKKAGEQLRKSTEHLEWDYIKEQFIEGRVVQGGSVFYRVRNNLKKCPICGGNFEDYEACSSRRDNETEVCGYCGETEAMDDYFGERR